MIVFSYKDAVDTYKMPTTSIDATPEDLFHMGDHNGVHYFTYNPDKVQLASNPKHDQKEYKTAEEKADLQEIIPHLVYLQAKVSAMKNNFLSQYDTFTMMRLAANSNAAFKTAINNKDTEINTYLTSLGF